MPLVRIDVPAQVPAARIAALADAVHASLVETVDVPVNDRFQVITAHPVQRLILDRTYPGVDRSGAALVVQVTFRRGRSEAKKRALYAALAARAEAIGIRPEDVMVVLQENTPVDWSFGAGIAHMAPAELVA